MNPHLEFIDHYINAKNSADGSRVDANANMSCKNVAVLASEIHKQSNIQIHRDLMSAKLSELFGEETAATYAGQLARHEIYTHDETAPFMPYCASVSLYPLLQKGWSHWEGRAMRRSTWRRSVVVLSIMCLPSRRALRELAQRLNS